MSTLKLSHNKINFWIQMTVFGGPKVYQLISSFKEFDFIFLMKKTFRPFDIYKKNYGFRRNRKMKF